MLKENSLSPTLHTFFDDGAGFESRPVRGRSVPAASAANAQIVGSCDLAKPETSTGESRSSVQLDAFTWRRIADGIQQRVNAVNEFLTDLLTHSRQPEFLRHHPIAATVCLAFGQRLRGCRPMCGVWSQLVSTDLLVDQSGAVQVLDQNFSCPIGLERLADLELQASGSSATNKWIQDVFSNISDQMADGLRVLMMDSGSFSAAYRENSYLARILGIDLVANRDLRVTAQGVFSDYGGRLRQVGTLIRRVDDDLLDPNCFRPDSLVGVPGLVRSCREGQVQVASMPGTGLFRNRAVNEMVPDMIRHYLNEAPLLASIRTLLCADLANRDLVLGDLTNYAVRTINVNHPARPFFGSTANSAQKADMTARLLKDPQQYVARPIVSSEDIGNDVAGRSAGGQFNLRVFGGGSRDFTLHPCGIGRQHQPDGGATVAITSDMTTFLVDTPS